MQHCCETFYLSQKSRSQILTRRFSSNSARNLKPRWKSSRAKATSSSWPICFPERATKRICIPWSAKKESVPQRMLFATIPEDPHNIEAESISANKVKITWNHSGGHREHYRISFFPHAPNAFPESPALVNGMLNEVIIEGLDGNTDYFFVVAAETYNVYSDGAFAQASTGTDWCLLKGTTC